MSLAARNWAWRQDLKALPKLTLVALAEAANVQGVCWPSVATIAAKACVSTRTARRAIQTLIRRNFRPPDLVEFNMTPASKKSGKARKFHCG